jgi:hypothetical protein
MDRTLEDTCALMIVLDPTQQDQPAAFYYLAHFRSALHWLRERYGDLLSERESAFIDEFASLPRNSQALLVRLIMRRGERFRASKIRYPEIGNIPRACGPLIELQWIDSRPPLSIDEFAKLVTRAELSELFPALKSNMPKAQALMLLQATQPEPRSFEEWRGSVSEPVYWVKVVALCTHLRLLFFGNFRQEWSEFVLADLGLFRYEAVPFSRQSRAFHSRQDIDDFLLLYECRRRLYEDAPLAEVLSQLPRTPLNHEWLEARRAKLLYQIARLHDIAGDRAQALTLYRESRHPGARLRGIRTLQADARHGEALTLARLALQAPESSAEEQRLVRVVRRLERRLGLPSRTGKRALRPERLDLIVPAPLAGESVEYLAQKLVSIPTAPAYFVENTLINSLFGLLCWEAIFAPVSGAFFHRFQVGPMDLFSPTFRQRRGALFDRCLEQLDSGCYLQIIKDNFLVKQGIRSPFVSWGVVTEDLLDTALACIPAAHLRHYFERLLSNLPENRSGLPDLVQFWIGEKRYRMIEVKGPGDRLQDNQQRWMEFCIDHELPVAVCHVRWAQTA